MSKTYLRSFFRKSGNILVSSLNRFWQDACYIKASALSFYTLQSIVPLLAFLLGIAKGFGFEKYLEKLISDTLQGQKEVIGHAIQIANSWLKVSKEGIIIGIGVIFLIWAVVNLMYYIEHSLNHILRIERDRSLFRKFTDYMAIILVSLLSCVVLTSVGLFITQQVERFADRSLLDAATALFSVFKVESWILSFLLLFILYYCMPNTTMRLWPTLIAAAFASIVLQLTQYIFINFITQFLNYNVIYGSLAVLPLFLIWLQMNWSIALFGFELAATIEDDVGQDQGNIPINKKELSFLVLAECLRSFYMGEPPPTALEISQKLKTPLHPTQLILEMLVKGHLLSLVEKEDEEKGYQPAASPETVSIKRVYEILEENPDFVATAGNTSFFKKTSNFLSKIDQAFKNSPSNLSLKDFLQKEIL